MRLKPTRDRLHPTGRTARHCMVVHAYYPMGETRVEREAKALLAQGIEVDIICLRAPVQTKKSLEGAAMVYRLPVKHRRGRGLAAQFSEYLAFFCLASLRLLFLNLRRRYDVIQVHNLPDFLVFVALFPKLMGAKIILDLHDLMPEFLAERSDRSLESPLVKAVCWQESVSCRFADHVITVTELWRQTLIERGQPADKITVVMNVADDEVFFPGAADHVHDDASFRLIYHGVFGHRHGLDLALMALKKIRPDAPDITMVLHGDGEYYETLKKLIAEFGLQDSVQFSEWGMPTKELPKLLAKTDLAIVPYRDGVFTGGILPTKLMEYAALGIPVVAARTPAMTSYFDETMVEFFSPGDSDGLAAAIMALYRDRRRLAELAHNIQRFNDLHSWAHVSAQYVALVERLKATSLDRD